MKPFITQFPELNYIDPLASSYYLWINADINMYFIYVYTYSTNMYMYI
jgi:hypothetical protein